MGVVGAGTWHRGRAVDTIPDHRVWVGKLCKADAPVMQAIDELGGCVMEVKKQIMVDRGRIDRFSVTTVG